MLMAACGSDAAAGETASVGRARFGQIWLVSFWSAGVLLAAALSSNGEGRQLVMARSGLACFGALPRAACWWLVPRPSPPPLSCLFRQVLVLVLPVEAIGRTG